MGELTRLSNIAEKMAAQLNAIGITTKEELLALGSKNTWLKIKAIDDSACYNRLCGLEGAIQGIRWHNLSQETKDDLKKFYQEHK